MVKLIDGNKIAEKIYKGIKDELQKNSRLKPGLAIIQVGEREDSLLYVKLKEKQAFKLGIETHLYKFSNQSQEKDILKTINFLNSDKNVDAILVQLPLPVGFDTDKIIKTINPEKDVDRFHPENLKNLLNGCNHKDVMPPVLEVVLEIFSEIDYKVKNKKIVIVSNSEIFGKSLAKVLVCLGADVESVFPDDENLVKKTLQADALISAVGKPNFIYKGVIKKNAIIIDIGITKKKKKVLGDVDFEDVQDKASYITPVPGGVGPITIAMLLKNVVVLAKQKIN